jgi:LmbE family N-acetylglucosaminyl deacetylase
MSGPRGKDTMSRFLCFCAHPDDAEFTCAGAMLRLVEAGHQGTLVVVTDGANGFKAAPLPAGERVAVREREQLESARVLGIADVVFLRYRDGFLEETEDLRARLVTEIRRVRPQTVFTFDPANQEFDSLNLFHRDHRITARAVFDALFAARNLWMYDGPPHAVETVLFYGTHRPDHFVDITGQIDRKLTALACHTSQFPDFARVERFIRDDISAPHGEFRHCERFRRLEVVSVV